jgi:hypothetical protein
MWEYVHMKAELTAEEQAHLSDCENCQRLFKICMLAESPDKIDLDDKSRERPA